MNILCLNRVLALFRKVPKLMHPSAFFETKITTCGDIAAEMYPHKIPSTKLSENIWTKYTKSNGNVIGFLESLDHHEKCAVIDKFNAESTKDADWAGAHQ